MSIYYLEPFDGTVNSFLQIFLAGEKNWQGRFD
jgi:hypothetical protein